VTRRTTKGAARGERHRFRGSIAGAGSTSGVRVVIGHWRESPLGSFSDAMVETTSGRRVLLAPRPEVAEFIVATYHFDETRIEPVEVVVAARAWSFRSPSLSLDLTVGGRTPVGRLLGLVPARLAESPTWCALTDPVARVVLRGVRTRGAAGNGRREWYGATDARAVVSVTGSFEGHDLGLLAPVEPPCRFGFSSTPRRPSVTEVVTTVESPRPSD
jgi:hypothetical protein